MTYLIISNLKQRHNIYFLRKFKAECQLVISNLMRRKRKALQNNIQKLLRQIIFDPDIIKHYTWIRYLRKMGHLMTIFLFQMPQFNFIISFGLLIYSKMASGIIYHRTALKNYYFCTMRSNILLCAYINIRNKIVIITWGRNFTCPFCCNKIDFGWPLYWLFNIVYFQIS